MRKLFTVLGTGVLVVALGAPAYAGFDNAQGARDDQVTAMRHRGDRGDGGRYRRHRHRYHDDRGYHRHGYRHRHYHSRYYGYPSYYGHPYGYGYYGRPAYDRRSPSRERECHDAYSYDRPFYDRYCRSR
jgi:hypothetical protein